MGLARSVSLFGVALLAGLGACSEPAPPPSVLLITFDTFRPDYMSSNGYDRPTTPYLDALVAEGTYFERAVTPVPRTTPALASLLAGAYPHTTGVRTLTSTLDSSVATITEVLAGAGYQTRAVVNNHILHPSRGVYRGFEDYRHLALPRTAAEVTGDALQKLDALDPARPMFFWVHYLDPHVPYEPPAELAEAFDPGYEGPHAERFTLRAPDLPESERARRIHQASFPERVNEHIRRLHAATYRALDDQLAPLVERARELYGERLVVVLSADHGESLGEHDFFWDHGDYVYDPGARVPLAFVFPPGHELRRSQRRTEWVSLVDVAPTLAELAGVRVPDAMRAAFEGRSLVPALRGEALEERPVFVESGHGFYPDLVRRRVRNDVAGRFRAVYVGDWKLIWTPFQEGALQWELYDLASDPGETRDLSEAEPEVVARLRRHLEAWTRASFLDQTPSMAGEDLEALEALGYVR